MRAAPSPRPTTPARRRRSATRYCTASVVRQRVEDHVQRGVWLLRRLVCQGRGTDEAVHVGGAFKHLGREAQTLKGERGLLQLADHAVGAPRLVRNVVDELRLDL